MKLRWGILGAAAIARKNWKGIWHSGNSVVTAVASRSAERSRQFIAECQAEKPFDTIPVALGGYEELRAAEAGKHVLCEKPCGGTVADVREMIDACQRNGVQFMDGVMFMHNPRLDRVRQALDNESAFGNIRRITSHFSFSSTEDFRLANIRSDAALEPLGCLGDLGWYCIRFALWTMNWKLPREVSGRIISQAGNEKSKAAVPFDFSGELFFENNVSSGFFCSFLSAYSNWVTVTGTQGQIRVPDFVLPKKSSQGALEIDGTLSDDLTINPATAQDANMIRAFASQVLSGKLNEAWPQWALKTQIVTNACLDSARTGHPVRLDG
jgi:predicted dehydrogenase